MIVITGATGALNGATTDHLLSRFPAEELVVVARTPEKARRFADLGVSVRSGDYADPGSLVDAFRGADQLLLVSSSDPTADAVALHTAAVDAAVQADVGHVLYTSHQGAHPRTPFGPGRDHAATEAVLERSGLAWTSLRNGFYAHSLLWLTGDWRTTGTIAVPADGPVSWTSREDAAEAAAVVVARIAAGDTGLGGPLTLTADEAPTFVDVAALASAASGRSVERVLVDPEEWVAAQVAAGRPERVARFTLGFYEAAGEGFFAGTSPLLGDLLGRLPSTVSDVLTA
ncbi:NAD(P)H-binding protein [Quadrisphaera setariae]|uniref:SDR family NAD(P)-dependent oxidoreductase n=1 Tax=Quadrisphaera setariae TaxID=2593304 RepID=A0A5C8ZE22_9ACTN|nr:NAD(P)H-binding protein [Quadrisphaera setariae]TXR55428.1 SDR family NAD(P)-dependent oxidoreductase [Quadrisphaera setariae]